MSDCDNVSCDGCHEGSLLIVGCVLGTKLGLLDSLGIELGIADGAA